ncbi:Na+/H+ antiporter [Spraguea lophii 42_110]|uniref:Na+/H+ antiporter n=1 Tax=Spraguea lophii (strain 42_110) TaxID=1358809 RepID=S7XT31_SPRLO|nr:Na+/H+ antiporter [Spraguea lophii 42_110]
MDCFFLTITILGAFIMVFGLISLFIKEKLYISETLVATVFGIIIGPYALKAVPIDSSYTINFSRIVICMQVICVGMIVPKTYLINEKRSLMMFLVPIMIISYIISSVAIHYILGLNWLYSFIIGACVTPTDPVLSSTALKGKFANRYVPQHLRNLLTIESGANDGLGFPMLTLPLYLLGYSKITKALYMWGFRTLFIEVFIAILIGICIGYISRKILYFSAERKLIDKESFLSFLIALTFFTTGFTAIFSLDDILACFITGMVFAYNRTLVNDIKDSHLYEVIDLLCNLSFFIFFGASIPFAQIKLKYIIVGIVLLFFRRLPVVLAFKEFVPQLFNYKEAVFAGWFGPIGVGAVFFAYHTQHEMEHFGKEFITLHNTFYEEIIPIIYTIVMCSIIVHGITAPIMHIHLKRKKANTITEISESEYTEFEDQPILQQ